MPVATLPVSVDDPIARVEHFMAELLADTSMSGSPVARAVRHHLEAGGRRLRARLAWSCARALAIEPDDTVALAAACELLHNASLVHDDLQDRDAVRRDRPAVWRAFGDDVALLGGDLLLSAAHGALARIATAPDLGALLHLVHERTAEAISGQAADLARTAKDLAGYEAVVAGESGALLSLPLELPMALARLDRHRPTARRAADAFALGYQIADDLDDVDSDGRGGANLVALLAPTHGRMGAERRAVERATEALVDAIELAETLPRGTGTVLAAHAGRLLDTRFARRSSR